MEKHDLLEYMDGKGIAKRLWPERLEVIDKIPRTATGKVQRFVLAKEIKHRMGIED